MPVIPGGAFHYYGLRVMIPVCNFMMVVSGVMLLVKAQKLQELDQTALNHEGSGDKLASCGILGISIAVMQTFLVLAYFLWISRTFAEDNPKFQQWTRAVAVAQGILLGLSLIYILLPHIHIDARASTELQAVRYATFVYIFFYSYILIGLVKSVWLNQKESSPIIYTNNGTGRAPTRWS